MALLGRFALIDLTGIFSLKVQTNLIRDKFALRFSLIPPSEDGISNHADQCKNQQSQKRRSKYRRKQFVSFELGGCLQNEIPESLAGDIAGEKFSHDGSDDRHAARDASASDDGRDGTRKPEFGQSLPTSRVIESE